MTTAFVFSGGASLGSIQAGMGLALDERGIKPDIVIGTSVGAMNAAWYAGGGTAVGLAEVWRGLRRQDLFPLRPLVGVQAFLGRRANFIPSSGVRRLLAKHLQFKNIEDASIPLTVLAADAQTGGEVVLRSGPAVQAVLASTALPGIFPPVVIGGRTLIDGGIANNTPITTAIEQGASEVWVLSTGYSCALPAPPETPLVMALHSIGLLVQQRLILETRLRTYPVPVHLIPPPCPISVSPVDFSQSAQLIEQAYRGTRQWLANDCPFALPLVFPHEHIYTET